MHSGKRSEGRSLTEEDRHLWNRISQTIKPLQGHRAGPAIVPQRDPPQPDRGAGASGTDMPAVRPARGLPEPAVRGNAILDEKTARKLAKRRIDIDSRIDLHGMTQMRAHAALQRFLEMASRRGDKIVLVITGKGREGGGILRRAVPLWLEESGMRAIAGAWRPAHPAHGGEGALYIRLRRNKG
jgi:DNA-nicking Smr family endonuclease